MKRQKLEVYFLTFQFILWFFSLNGQNFVTDPKGEIQEHFDSLQVQYSINTTGDGLEYLHFKDGEITVSYYFNNVNICIVYKMFFPEDGFRESIDALDNSFEPLNGGKWREFDGQQYFIWSLDRLEKGYSITVTAEFY